MISEKIPDCSRTLIMPSTFSQPRFCFEKLIYRKVFELPEEPIKDFFCPFIKIDDKPQTNSNNSMIDIVISEGSDVNNDISVDIRPTNKMCENFRLCDSSNIDPILEEFGIQTVKNSQGKEFIYYQSLDEVKKVMGRKFPNMPRDQMYKELLRPYKYRTVAVPDEENKKDKELYYCGYDDCTKHFSKVWNLVDHLRMHEGLRPYYCETCDKFFTQKGNLKKHMRQHTLQDVNDRKKFSCHYCGKGYTERYNLMAHIKKHSENDEIEFTT